MRLTDNLQPSIGSWHHPLRSIVMLRARTLKKSFKEPYNAKQTTPCSNRNGLSQKRPRPFLSICISSNVGSRKVFSPRFRIAVSHMVPSLTLSPSISSVNCSVFHSRCDSLPPFVPDPVPLSSCPVSPPPQTLIFSIATPEILLRPSVFRPGLSVRDHRDAAVVNGTRTATSLLKIISEELHKQIYSHRT